MSKLHKFKKALQGKGKYLTAVATLAAINDQRPHKTLEENVTHLIVLFPEYSVFKNSFLIKSSE